MADGQRRLGALLLEMGVLDEAQLHRALGAQGRSGQRLGQLLVDLGYIDEKPLVEALSHQLGLERWDPDIWTRQPHASIHVPEDMAFGARVVPIQRTQEAGQEVMVLATADPLAPLAGHVVRFLSDRGTTVRWVLATESDIDRGLRDAYAGVRLEGSERRRSGSLSPALDGYAVVVKGRPETPPPAQTRPAVEPVRVDCDVSPHPLVLEPEVSPERAPALVEPRGLGSPAPVGVDRTLLADDAVLEVVELEDTPVALDVAILPLDGLEAAVSSGRQEASAQPPRPRAGEAVALARLAIRRADGGVRERAAPEVLERHPSASGPNGDLSLEVLTPVPHVARPAAADADQRFPPLAPESPSIAEVRTDDMDEVFVSEPTASDRFDEASVVSAGLVPRADGTDEGQAVDEPLDFELLEPVPPEKLDPPAVASSSTEDRASELHARLIRFAAGEALPEAHRDEAFRVVVAALLKRGLVDEAGILSVLLDSAGNMSRSGQ